MNLGVDNLGWAPSFCDYKHILNELKSEDEMRIYGALSELNQQLAMAQENTIQSFSTDAFVPVLIECLKREQINEIANEIACKTPQHAYDVFR